MTDMVQELFFLAEKKGLVIHKNLTFPGWTVISRAGCKLVLSDIFKVKSLVENYNSPKA